MEGRRRSRKGRDEAEKETCKLALGFSVFLANKQIKKGSREWVRLEKLRTSASDSGFPVLPLPFLLLFLGLRPCSLLHGEGAVSAAFLENDLADSIRPESKHLERECQHQTGPDWSLERMPGV